MYTQLEGLCLHHNTNQKRRGAADLLSGSKRCTLQWLRVVRRQVLWACRTSDGKSVLSDIFLAQGISSGLQYRQDKRQELCPDQVTTQQYPGITAARTARPHAASALLGLCSGTRSSRGSCLSYTALGELVVRDCHPVLPSKNLHRRVDFLDVVWAFAPLLNCKSSQFTHCHDTS